MRIKTQTVPGLHKFGIFRKDLYANILYGQQGCQNESCFIFHILKLQTNKRPTIFFNSFNYQYLCEDTKIYNGTGFFQLSTMIVLHKTSTFSLTKNNTLNFMNNEIRNLEPKVLWNKFADLNAVPRPSKKEERVIKFIKEFGEDLGLETHVDKVGNVIIKKPATSGMEDRKPVILQAHLDMVHQKNSNTNFDFDTNGIEMFIDGDWVRARGTTLWADNGLGVASIMAVLESHSIAHPELEALFTIDEETGMTGAQGLEPGLLKGEILLNLDTEEDDEIGIGCAGGVDVTA